MKSKMLCRMRTLSLLGLRTDRDQAAKDLLICCCCCALCILLLTRTGRCLCSMLCSMNGESKLSSQRVSQPSVILVNQLASCLSIGDCLDAAGDSHVSAVNYI